MGKDFLMEVIADAGLAAQLLKFIEGDLERRRMDSVKN